MVLRRSTIHCLVTFFVLGGVGACGSDDGEPTSGSAGGTGGVGGSAAGAGQGGDGGSGAATGGVGGVGGAQGGTGGSSAGTGGEGGMSGGSAGSAGSGGNVGPGEVETLAVLDDDTEHGLAVDDTHVYWGGHGLFRVVKGGGQSEAVTVAGSVPWVKTVRVDADALYFSPRISATDRVFKVSKTGGAATLLGSNPDMETTAGADFVLTSAEVLWLQTAGLGKVAKVAKTGGERTVLATDLSGPTGIDVFGNDVFWSNWVSEKIQKVSLTGGAVTEIANDQNYPWAIRVTSDGVFWVNRGVSGDTPTTEGSVMRLVSGGTPETLADGLAGPNALDVDSTHVYFTCYFDGTVRRVPIAGGAETILAADQTSPTAIVTDSSHVYWVDVESVKRIAK